MAKIIYYNESNKPLAQKLRRETTPGAHSHCLPLWGRWQPEGLTDEVLVGCELPKGRCSVAKIIYYNESNKPLAQKLRRETTPQERHLWYDYLRSCRASFRRQKQFGRYIVDFYCASARLVLEIDGSQHYDPEGKQRDEVRDKYLADLGLTVLRFSNYDIDRHFDGVCATIERYLQDGK